MCVCDNSRTELYYICSGFFPILASLIIEISRSNQNKNPIYEKYRNSDNRDDSPCFINLLWCRINEMRQSIHTNPLSKTKNFRFVLNVVPYSIKPPNNTWKRVNYLLFTHIACPCSAINRKSFLHRSQYLWNFIYSYRNMRESGEGEREIGKIRKRCWKCQVWLGFMLISVIEEMDKKWVWIGRVSIEKHWNFEGSSHVRNNSAIFCLFLSYSLSSLSLYLSLLYLCHPTRLLSSPISYMPYLFIYHMSICGGHPVSSATFFTLLSLLLGHRK